MTKKQHDWCGKHTTFRNQEVSPPIPIPMAETDNLVDYPYGWIYCEDFGFFVVNCVGVHEWTLALIEGVLRCDANVDEYTLNLSEYADSLLRRPNVAYMSSRSANIYCGKEENLSSALKARLLRDGEIVPIL